MNQRDEEVFMKYVETDKLVTSHYEAMATKLESILKQHKREKSDL